MTDKDKTSDQLVASIRKSKSGAAGAKKAPVRRTAAKKTVKKTVAKKTPATTADPFQCAGRVWPD